MSLLLGNVAANPVTCINLTVLVYMNITILFQSKASMQFEMKTLQQNLDKETSERKSAMAQLDARNRKYASIEGAKSEQMKGLYHAQRCIFCFNPFWASAAKLHPLIQLLNGTLLVQFFFDVGDFDDSVGILTRMLLIDDTRSWLSNTIASFWFKLCNSLWW